VYLARGITPTSHGFHQYKEICPGSRVDSWLAWQAADEADEANEANEAEVEPPTEEELERQKREGMGSVEVGVALSLSCEIMVDYCDVSCCFTLSVSHLRQVGMRVRVRFELECGHKWYGGVVSSVNASQRTAEVVCDDGDATGFSFDDTADVYIERTTDRTSSNGTKGCSPPMDSPRPKRARQEEALGGGGNEERLATRVKLEQRAGQDM
jgi:hypothetical protein